MPISLNSSINLSGNSVAKNRLFKSAMSEQLADKNQRPTEALINLYRVWAQGGAGVLVTGNVMLAQNAIGEPRNVVLDENSDADLFRRWAQAGSENDTRLWMQLNHPGKQIPNLVNSRPVAPSAVPLGKGFEMTFNCPRELTENEIEEIIGRFAFSASRAKEWGFGGVQIHSAHGYLCNQFLSPHHNRRTDKWGGSLENRMRFLREVYRAIRSAVGQDFPVGVKLNSADFQKGGFDEDDSIKVIQTLQDDGIDLIEVSGGNYENPSMTGANVKESTRKREAYFLEYAEKAKKVLHVPLVVTGGFRSAPAMIEALQSGATDMIGIARPLAVDPNLPQKLLSNDQYKMSWPKPSTGLRFLDSMALIDLTWYEHQLALIAKGKTPKPNFSAWLSVFKTFSALGLKGLQPRRS